MNINQLKYMIAISKSPSMSVAAQMVHMTPQALGIAVRNLENELGLALLSRSAHGVVLTEDGWWLVELAEQFLGEIASHKAAKCKLLAMPVGTVSIAVNHLGVDNYFWAQFLQMMYDKAPQLNVELDEMPAGEAVRRVLEGERRLGYICQTTLDGEAVDELPEALAFAPVYDGRMVCVAHEELPIARFGSTSLKAMGRYRLIMYAPNSAYANPALQQIFERYHLLEQLRIESSYPIYRGKIKKGYGVSLAIHLEGFEPPFHDVPQVRLIPLRDELRICMGSIRRHDAKLDENERYVQQMLERFTREKKAKTPG